MSLALVLSSALLSASCGSRERGDAQESRRLAASNPAPTAEPALTPEPDPPEPFPSCNTLGVAAETDAADVTFSPSPDAWQANRRGLDAHRNHRYAEALALFQEADANGRYPAARFNAACALSKLGRLDDARDAVRDVACRDLPSTAARIRNDEDLDAIRSPELDAFLAATAAQYAEAAAPGVSLVIGRAFDMTRYLPDERADNVPHYHDVAWTQAVSYLPDSGRIIPVGPRMRRRSHRGGFPMVATRWVRSRGVVLTATYQGNQAEDPNLDGLRVTTHTPFVGEQTLSAFGPRPEELPVGHLGVRDDGVVVEAPGPISDTMLQWVLRAEGRRRVRGASPSDGLYFGQLSWVPTAQEPPEGMRVQGRHLITPEGRVRTVGRHPRPMAIVVNEAAGIAVVGSGDFFDCGVRPRGSLEVVDLRARRASVIHTEGMFHYRFDAHGALLVESSAGLQRFEPAPASPSTTSPVGLGVPGASEEAVVSRPLQAPVTLPARVRMSTSPFGFNPYC